MIDLRRRCFAGSPLVFALRPIVMLILAGLAAADAPARAQAVLSGRLTFPRTAADPADRVPLSAVHCFASRENPLAEPAQFRTWETAPAGWYRLAGAPGRYSLLFATPGHYIRPLLLNNVFADAVDPEIVRDLSPRFDFACFDDRAYDPHRAAEVFQTFRAQGTSVTSVGFKLAHDGVDGPGPQSQTILVSIHRRAPGTPDRWPQVGLTAVAVEVDCGGPKSYAYSVGWNSGEVPLQPGETYAVRLRPEDPAASFQVHWGNDSDQATDCYRIPVKGSVGWQGRDLWLAVATDGDGLLIPYNKRVHKPFGELTRCLPKWSQSYVAQGTSLAAVQVYAAVSGAQPPIYRQRLLVRVREQGPAGKQVGRDRVAIGNGNYTGDASWGLFGTVFSPGEIPLTPGQTYAIEWESLENFETLHGFVNIKGEVSNDRPGFNPYRKHPRDPYLQGTAWLDGQDQGFDLDAQVIEYAHAPAAAPLGLESPNLLSNGSLQTGDSNPERSAAEVPTSWKTFQLAPATRFESVAAAPTPESAPHPAAAEAPPRWFRVLGSQSPQQPIDGGLVQRVEGLSRGETYTLSGLLRASWPVDDARQCMIGLDPTGQTDDPSAATIRWTRGPDRHGIFDPISLGPVRPRKDALSVWLRARGVGVKEAPFRADFANFGLFQIRTLPPLPAPRSATSGPAPSSAAAP